MIENKLKAHQVRIGNWVSMKCDGDTFNTMVDVGDFMDINRNYKKIKSIALSEEWLLKFGFEFVSAVHPMCLGDKYVKKYTPVAVEQSLHLQLIDENLWMFLEGNLNIHISTVHDLQNLYQVITGGQELTVAGLSSPANY